jgi:hypothetical protein
MIRILIQGATFSLLNIAQLFRIVQPLKSLKLGACVAPVALAHISMPVLIIGYLMTQGSSIFWQGATLFGMTYGLPTLMASIILRRMRAGMSSLERTAWSAGCLLAMILFSLHPQVGYGFGFSLYWLIPAIIIMRAPENIVGQAISASFIAHIVGSWCYLLTVPTIPDFWMHLIPLVAFERAQYAALLAAALVVQRGVSHRILQAIQHLRAVCQV